MNNYKLTFITLYIILLIISTATISRANGTVFSADWYNQNAGALITENSNAVNPSVPTKQTQINSDDIILDIDTAIAYAHQIAVEKGACIFSENLQIRWIIISKNQALLGGQLHIRQNDEQTITLMFPIWDIRDEKIYGIKETKTDTLPRTAKNIREAIEQVVGPIWKYR